MISIFRRVGVSSLLAVLGLTAVLQPKPANALVGIVVWPCFIAGAALEAIAITDIVYVSITGDASPATWAIFHVSFWTGLILLDNEQGSYTPQVLSLESAQKYGLTDSERKAYNRAVENGQIEEIFQQASVNLQGVKKPTMYDVKDIMSNLMTALNPDAHHAFTKIAVQLAHK